MMITIDRVSALQRRWRNSVCALAGTEYLLQLNAKRTKPAFAIEKDWYMGTPRSRDQLVIVWLDICGKVRHHIKHSGLLHSIMCQLDESPDGRLIFGVSGLRTNFVMTKVSRSFGSVNSKHVVQCIITSFQASESELIGSVDHGQNVSPKAMLNA